MWCNKLILVQMTIQGVQSLCFSAKAGSLLPKFQTKYLNKNELEHPVSICRYWNNIIQYSDPFTLIVVRLIK